MTEEKQDDRPAVAPRARGPLVCFAVLTVLNALFWFTVNFDSFVPPSSGVFAERLHFFGITQAGPLAFFFISMPTGDYVLAGVVGAGIAGCLFLCTRVPRSRTLVWAGCIGIILWFFLGFAVAGLRIT